MPPIGTTTSSRKLSRSREVVMMCNAEAFAKVLEQKGLKIKNQATFEQAINQGLTDGAALADLKITQAHVAKDAELAREADPCTPPPQRPQPQARSPPSASRAIR